MCAACWPAAGTRTRCPRGGSRRRGPAGMTPGDIDRYVRGVLASGGDLYTLHAGALARLRPDLILTQDLCRVCALPSGQVTEALGYLGARADVLSLDPYTLEDVLATITRVGRRGRVPDRGPPLVVELWVPPCRV